MPGMRKKREQRESERRAERRRVERRRRTSDGQSSSEMSHSLRGLVSRSVLEDGDMDVGRSEEGSCGEDGFEELSDDGLRVEEVESDVEALRFRNVRGGLISFL